MASALPDEVVNVPGDQDGASPDTSTPASPGTPPKLKARQRLLNGLQRIASSPSLPKGNRTRSSSLGSWKLRKGSISCVSLSSTLSSGQCWGDPNTSKLFGNGHPDGGVANGNGVQDEDHTPARVVGTEIPVLNGNIQTSIPLPADVRPSSRATPLESTAEVPEGTKTEAELEETEVTTQKLEFWLDMPPEIRMSILQYLEPKDLISCSRVSKSWYSMCFDGQLWASLDTSTYYSEIPHDCLVKIIVAAGPFLRSLNLRGCIQLQNVWPIEGERISDACRNLANLNVEDSLIDKSSIHYFLLRNPSLVHLSMRGLPTVTNSSMKIISQSCPNLEYLNVSWCENVDTKGLKRVVKACNRLTDLRASEVSGFDDENFMLSLFESNTLERLILSRCSTITDSSLKVLLHGMDPDIDLLTGCPIVPPRKLRHLDLSRCRGLTDAGVKHLVNCVPDLEGLHLSYCPNVTDATVGEIVQTTPQLSHLDLEELENLTNQCLVELSKAECAATLEHLNISYCERIGDTGMLKVLKNCPKIRSLDLDNTRVSDLTMMELCSQMRKRGYGNNRPELGVRAAVFDCGNVTWAGVREVLSNNTFVPRYANISMNRIPEQADRTFSSSSLSSSDGTDGPQTPAPSAPAAGAAEQHSSPPSVPASIKASPEIYPREIIQLKCFYGWQMTVDEHTKRVLRGNLAAANRLERKWADYMMATEEAGVAGASARRRRRRAREAEMMFADDDDDDDDNWYGPAGLAPLGGRRRRARSGGCVVM